VLGGSKGVRSARVSGEKEGWGEAGRFVKLSVCGDEARTLGLNHVATIDEAPRGYRSQVRVFGLRR